MKVLALLLVCVGATLAEITKTCDEDPDPGRCLAYIPRYYYDRQSGTCKKFIYGGCQGNGNRYETEEECLKHCAGRDRADADVCELDAETGPCKAAKPRYFYNRKTGQCERFIYGGCGGNGNNFRSIEECERRCSQRTDVDVCTLEPETGPCRAYFPKYYFNAKTGKCEKFVYGGCQGNGNRFDTEEQCYGTCDVVQRAEDYCSLEPETGMCRGYFPRYFFNKDKGVCEEFIYGGCGGNKNNFITFEDCSEACGNV